MTDRANYDFVHEFPATPWLLLPAELGEAVAVLKEALGDDWVLERETDYAGEVSIIAFPVREDQRTPSFILFESEGCARWAAIIADEWEWHQAFASFAEAVRAFIAGAQAYQPRGIG